jgi:lipid II:glycine glycyltransferase (peptidoglycan interpeptide bridge formation enzyme)
VKLRIANCEFEKYFDNFKKSPNEVQPKNTLILDITKPEEDLLKEMKPKTRYNIRLAGKKELRIKNYELRMDNKIFFKEKFEEFWGLVKETSARDKFRAHNKNYYWKMMESLNGDKTKSDTASCRLRAKLYLAEYDNEIVAANIVLYFGDLAVYLHGASSNKHRNVMAPYLLQWRQILDAKNAGCQKYDFWGIARSQKSLKSIKSKVNDWSGITRFKKGFGGKEKNYIGAYDLIFRRREYELYKFVKKIKNRN